MIETEGLTKRFGQNLALDGLTLRVREGEVLGLLGPNGAGKTTTVRLLTCLIAPSAGRARVNGLEVGRDDHEIRQIVGILTESPGLYEKLSAEQNLSYFARLYGMDEGRRAEQVRRYLGMLGLWERRDEAVVGFSKGMKQKLSIARALLHEPKVVFMDEPTSALDPESARIVREFIAELRTQGRTIVLCTHNLDEADRLCDRIGILKQRLITVDTPSRLRTELYGRRVEIRLREVVPAVLEAVRPLVSGGRLEVDGNRISLSIDNPEEKNPAVIRAIVQAGGEIQFVTEQRHSLEDVYMSLVNGAAER